jgi:succinate dehydrogenase/fumarate reductase flavoprotein subunit
MTPKHYNFLVDAAGIDLAKEPLEVAPASHYQCGGIYVNERGQSVVDGLYACGECAGNFQGANRLAGSALCDTQTTGAQCGGSAAKDSRERGLLEIDEKDLKEKTGIIDDFLSSKRKPVRPVFIKEQILKTMDEYIAPFRDEKGMKKGLSNLKSLRDEVKKISVPDTGRFNLELREAIETGLMLDAAELTFGSALFRKESRGHHNRFDYPETDNKDWRCHTIAYLDGERMSFKKRDVIYTRLKPEDV